MDYLPTIALKFRHFRINNLEVFFYTNNSLPIYKHDINTAT